MDINYNYLFYYLEKENIIIDKTEFTFQIQSHPDYPSLLAISDTLSFFNIENGAVRVEFSDFEFLPSQFITLLNVDNNKPILYFIEKKNQKIYITEDKKTEEIDVLMLKKRWTGIVLLAEKSHLTIDYNKKSNLFFILPTLCLFIFLISLIKFETNIIIKLFYIFPIIGVLFSIAALKDLFGAKSEFISNFCNISATTSCNSIVGSDKWKVFNYINFSDLSIVFFTSQFINLITLLFFENIEELFSVHFFLLFASIPVIFLSIYFQKFVEKKWCPICLAIISIIILELVYITFMIKPEHSFKMKSFILFSEIFIFVLLIWSFLKKLLIDQKNLKENQLESNRFKRNYEVFKSLLISSPKIKLPNTPIVLGNSKSNTEITMITSPFCGYCKDAHNLIEDILYKYGESLKINIIFSSNYEFIDNERKKVYLDLLDIYFDEGEETFNKALKKWFIEKDPQVLNQFKKSINEKYDNATTLMKFDEWCVENKFNFTPSLFINSFQYPKRLYNRESIMFFIDEIIEDTNF